MNDFLKFPFDLPAPDGEPEAPEFYGRSQDAEKLALCRHIMEMADGIKRAAPYHIRTQCGDPANNTQPGWMLSLDLHSPTVLLSLPLRRRLCEMLLAADQLIITAVPEENCTRFSCIVTELWRA